MIYKFLPNIISSWTIATDHTNGERNTRIDTDTLCDFRYRNVYFKSFKSK